jgi:predicted PurR-regulated permease PerM
MPGLGDKIRSAGQQISAAGPDLIPGWMMVAGIGSWMIAGIAVVFWLLGWFFVTTASISIPLVLAAVVGMIAYPLCEKMIARKIPKSVAALIVLLALVAVLVAVVWLVVGGITAQVPAIEKSLNAGVADLTTALASQGIDVSSVNSAISSTQDAAKAAGAPAPSISGGLVKSLAGTLSSTLSAVFAAAFSIFICLMLLYYVLSDFPTMTEWISTHMGGLPLDVAHGVIEDAVNAMRGYFRATTITGFAVAAVIGATMLIMGIPLALTVALVTFLTCYIPFFGAIISGAFAFMIALSSNGMPTAIALLVIVLLTQNVLQTVINARVMGDSLNLHPLVVLVVTMLGGIFAGILGAALAAPLAALLVNAGKRLAEAFQPAPEPEETA